MIPFNYHHLYYFYIIAQEGSISKATKTLRLAQPTLSAQLKQFEKFLKVTLFTRENKKLILTEEGRQVLSYAKDIFDIGKELKGRFVDLTFKGRPQLSIGVTNHLPKTIVDIILDFILTQAPNTYIILKKDNMLQLLEELEHHLVDIILTDTPFETPINNRIENHLLGKIPIVFCAHPSIAKRIKRFPQDLNQQPLLIPAAPMSLNIKIKEYYYEHKIKPHLVGEIQDIETVRRLALRGYGIAPLNLLTIQNAPAKQPLTILNKSLIPGLEEKVYLIHKHRRHPHPLISPLTTSFKFNSKK